MASLYVVSPDAQVQLRAGRLVVVRDDRVIGAASLEQLGELVLVGRADITVPALHALLDRDARVVFLSYGGKVLGRLTAGMGKNHPRRRVLYARAQDPAFCLAFSRDLVGAKLANSRALALRWVRELRAEGVDIAPWVLDSVTGFDARLAAAPSLEALRAIEGEVARAYYLVLRSRLRDPWHFPRRSRRPPRDPANALLSIVYTLLTQSVVSALEIVGLDPYEGLYHADKYGRPALALDMVEEYRAYIGDSLLLRLANRRMLDPGDFQEIDGGFALRPKGWRVLMAQYHARLNQEVLVRDVGRRLSLRQVMELQARRLAALLEGRAAAYRPFRIR